MADSWKVDIDKAGSVNNTFEGIMWKSVEGWSQFRQHIQLWLQTFESLTNTLLHLNQKGKLLKGG